MSDNEKPTTDYGDPAVAHGDVHEGDEPPHHGMSVGEYLSTRVSSLKPPMTRLPNPLRLIAMLTAHHWAFFGVAFFAWVCVVCSTSKPTVVYMCVCVCENAD